MIRVVDNGSDMYETGFADDDSSRVDFGQVCGQMTASVRQNLAAGDAVRAFNHVNDHPGTYRYVRLLTS